MRPELPLHEWLIVFLLVLLLLMFASLSMLNRPDVLPVYYHSPSLAEQLIEVTVEGAVEVRGQFSLKKGSLIKDLFEQAKPLENADLSKFRVNQRLRDNQKIVVAYQRYIAVYVEGAIAEPITLKLKEGSQLKDVIPLLSFLPNADTQKLEKKRKLKDLEVIKVSLKKK